MNAHLKKFRKLLGLTYKAIGCQLSSNVKSRTVQSFIPLKQYWHSDSKVNLILDCASSHSHVGILHHPIIIIMQIFKKRSLYKMIFMYILPCVCLRWYIVSAFFLQYMELHVTSWIIYLQVIDRPFLFHLLVIIISSSTSTSISISISIIKSEIWLIDRCFG